jgi:hypothetical protein
MGTMMLIEIDFNRDDWRVFAATIPEDSYDIVEEFWEDCEEWAHIRITDTKWQQWVERNHPHWVIDAT